MMCIFLDHLIGTNHPEYSSAEESNFQIQQGPRQARNTIPGGHQSMPAFLPGTPALRALPLPQTTPGQIFNNHAACSTTRDLSLQMHPPS